MKRNTRKTTVVETTPLVGFEADVFVRDNDESIILTHSYGDTASFITQSINKHGDVTWEKDIYVNIVDVNNSEIHDSTLSESEDRLLQCGQIKGTIEFDDISIQTGSRRNGFVALLDIEGDYQWVSITAGEARSCAWSGKDSLVGGYIPNSSNRGFVSKLDKDGKVKWTKQVPEVVYAVGGGLDGSSLIYSYPNATKLSSNGDILWKSNVGNSSITGIQTDGQGNFLITGTFSGSIRLGDTTLQSAGKHGTSDILVAKLDSNGELIPLGNKGRITCHGRRV